MEPWWLNILSTSPIRCILSRPKSNPRPPLIKLLYHYTSFFFSSRLENVYLHPCVVNFSPTIDAYECEGGKKSRRDQHGSDQSKHQHTTQRPTTAEEPTTKKDPALHTQETNFFSNKTKKILTTKSMSQHITQSPTPNHMEDEPTRAFFIAQCVWYSTLVGRPVPSFIESMGFEPQTSP